MPKLTYGILLYVVYYNFEMTYYVDSLISVLNEAQLSRT